MSVIHGRPVQDDLCHDDGQHSRFVDGHRSTKQVSMQCVHGIAGVIFAIIGMLTLFNVGQLL